MNYKERIKGWYDRCMLKLSGHENIYCILAKHTEDLFELTLRIYGGSKIIEMIDNLEKELQKTNEKVISAEAIEKKYTRYLQKLKKEFSDHLKQHQMFERLASVETRITQMEMANGNASTTLSGSTRTDKDSSKTGT